VRAVVAWARANRQPDAPILRQRPFPDEHAPELIGCSGLPLHQLHDQHILGGIAVSAGGHEVQADRKRAALPVFRRLLARDVRPGESLELLAAALPDDLAWAQGDVIAAAFGRARRRV